MYDVVLVDDEQIIVNGLSKVFPWAQYGCRVAGTAVDGRDGLAQIRLLRPQLLFTDIRMPNMDGLSMVAALKSEFPTMQITVLTAFRDFEYARQAIRLGVCRYLLKPSRMDELHEAVAAMTRKLDEAQALSAAMAAQPAEPGDTFAGDVPGEAGGAEPEGDAGGFVARAALRYIEEHCAEHLTLSDVADSVYVSQWHLSKLINRHAQQSFFDVLNHCRVQRSLPLLADPMYRVSEVAYAVGYADVAHFSRIFKKVTGKTPMEYRGSLK